MSKFILLNLFKIANLSTELVRWGKSKCLAVKGWVQEWGAKLLFL